MKVSFFIDRPVFSIVISILIVIIGIIGLTMLPVDQYPPVSYTHLTLPTNSRV